MPTIAVVPAPASVTPGPDAAPFRLSPATHTGEDAAGTTWAALVLARAGLASEAAPDAAVRFTLASGGAAESYRLTVDAASVSVTAPDAAGLFYGAQTLGQLLQSDDEGWLLPAVTIEDSPRFAYRGVMLDVARHFFDVTTVCGYIDRAAGLKFNHLHLHLSDDQGWRLALAARPELTEKASATAVGGDAGGFFTADDYATIIAHAATRHMTVVPELDMPGHTHAVGLAYPELLTAPVLSPHVEEVAELFGGGLPTAGEPYTGLAVGFSSLDTRSEATYDFVADVFGALAAMTPGPYLHFGGDESLATSAEDFAAFVSRVSQLIADLGKTPIAWHEAGAAAQLSDETIGQYWGFLSPTDGMDDKARAFVANGARLILSPADAVYLDMKERADAPLGLTWANGPTSVQRAYEWEPVELLAGVGERDILGVEAPMWTETIRTAADIDAMAFPRIAAAAEAAWSPRTGAHAWRTWESFRTRVGALGPLWTALGVRFTPSPEIEWSDGS